MKQDVRSGVTTANAPRACRAGVFSTRRSKGQPMSNACCRKCAPRVSATPSPGSPKNLNDPMALGYSAGAAAIRTESLGAHAGQCPVRAGRLHAECVDSGVYRAAAQERKRVVRFASGGSRCGIL